MPVVPGIASRFWLHAFGKTWTEYTSDPRTMLELQLAAHKWTLENVLGDVTGVSASPDLFSFYGESYGLGCELGCDDLTPWIASHPIQTAADLARLEAIDAADNRYTDAVRGWIARMEPLLEDYQIHYADGIMQRPITRLGFGYGSIGVFTLATDLRGPEIYADLYERPDFARELLRIVTDKVIARYRWLGTLAGGAVKGMYLVDDSSGALSPGSIRRSFIHAWNAWRRSSAGR